MSQLVLHPATEKQLQSFSREPGHALLLLGPTGAGKFALAQRLSEQLLNIDSFAAYPYGLVLSPKDNKAIGIDDIRQLEKFLSLKVPSQQSLSRIAIIEQAHLLTTESQNALLKTLEEPPAGTVIILTASYADALLPTVRSRVQTLTVGRPSKEQLAEHLTSTNDAMLFDQAYAVSGGLPGLLSALLSDEAHPLKEATDYARRILSEPVYSRLLLVDELTKRPTLARDTLFILEQMATTSLKTATGASAKRWQTVLASSYRTNEALASNAQVKLALTNLMLNL